VVAAVAVTEVRLFLAIRVSRAVCTVTSSALAASVCPEPTSPVTLGRTTAASTPSMATTISSSTRVKPLLSRLIVLSNLRIIAPPEVIMAWIFFHFSPPESAQNRVAYRVSFIINHHFSPFYLYKHHKSM